MARTGVLGGTFNPPHLAHLVCASEAAAQLGLDRVLVMPVAAPPHKEALLDPGAEERYRLCRLATQGDECLEVSRLEVERGGPSYTVDTLRELHATTPEDDLTLIVGADMALGLPSWREPEAILGLARLAVAERSGAGRQDIAERLDEAFAGLKGFTGPDIAFFDMPRLDVSSSQIRRRVSEGRPIRYLVPDAVAERIQAARLYR
ncbi:MAG: nicotinate (nicotinamide) nucleotide adenylyltransferase [Solirubrobacterales bacterium]|nr:nicotinate (nicotinamide) nucleotide adenylyltransferase [Solirubrobacterales bacterium]